jgi:hypothetical protein
MRKFPSLNLGFVFLVWLFLVLGCFSGIGGGSGPTDAEARRALEEGRRDRQDNSYRTRIVHSITFGQPRAGDSFGDGIPAGSGQTVYPAEVDMTTEYHNIHSNNLISSSRETFRCVFWRDSMNEWTFRRTSNR